MQLPKQLTLVCKYAIECIIQTSVCIAIIIADCVDL